MEPQLHHVNSMLVLGLQFLGIIGGLYFLRRINMRFRRQSYTSLSRLTAHHSMAIKQIRQIEEVQTHDRLTHNLRISRICQELNQSQLQRLAQIDKYQEHRLIR